MCAGCVSPPTKDGEREVFSNAEARSGLGSARPKARRGAMIATVHSPAVERKSRRVGFGMHFSDTQCRCGELTDRAPGVCVLSPFCFARKRLKSQLVTELSNANL